MEQYTFTKDRLIRVWQREVIVVEAENHQDALDLAKDEDCEAKLVDTLWDTAVDIVPEENDNQCTIEIFDGAGKCNENAIWDNTPQELSDCCKAPIRELRCDECKENGKWCPIEICTNCGDTVVEHKPTV